jgi:hypothetical protein
VFHAPSQVHIHLIGIPKYVFEIPMYTAVLERTKPIDTAVIIIRHNDFKQFTTLLEMVQDILLTDANFTYQWYVNNYDKMAIYAITTVHGYSVCQEHVPYVMARFSNGDR